MTAGVGPEAVAKLRAAVEMAAITIVAAYLPFFQGYKSVSKDFIEKQVAAELQRQGADSGTANVAARQAADMYTMHSKMGNVSLPAVLKEAGNIAERMQKGFKFKPRAGR